LAARDASGDEEDKPLKLRIIAPKKPLPKKKKAEPEKVGVGAKQSGEDAPRNDAPAVEGGDSAEPQPE
jgi:hypothetical protein